MVSLSMAMYIASYSYSVHCSKLNFFKCYTDVNECSNKETHNCSQNAQCLDKKCGYSCQCKPGYYIGEDNYTCLGRFAVL